METTACTAPRFPFSLFLTLVLFSTTGIAQQPDAYVPSDLEPWRQWVLQGEEFRNCPFYSNRGAGLLHVLPGWQRAPVLDTALSLKEKIYRRLLIAGLAR